MTKKTRVWFSHPDQENSIVNKAILNQLTTTIKDLEVRNLDLLYPDYKIDKLLEQEILQQTNRIILMFPIYWVGMPSLLTLWREKVFTKDFAYTDPMSNKKSVLADKELIVLMSLGAPEKAYTKEGFIQEEWAQYTKWIESMAHFTGMELKKTYSFFNARISNAQNQQILDERITEYTKEIVDFLQS